MIPFEREIYVSMIIQYLEQEKKKLQQSRGSS